MNLKNIPDELKHRQQWVCWNEKKVPIHPHTGEPASVSNSATWSNFEEVANSSLENGQGVGFVCTAKDPYTMIDLDHAINSSGDLKEYAQDFMDTCKSFTEISPSGKGLHIIAKADKFKWWKNRVNDSEGINIEIYDDLRYFTMTGDVIGDYSEIVSLDENRWLKLLRLYLKSKTTGTPVPQFTAPTVSIDLSNYWVNFTVISWIALRAGLSNLNRMWGALRYLCTNNETEPGFLPKTQLRELDDLLKCSEKTRYRLLAQGEQFFWDDNGNSIYPLPPSQVAYNLEPMRKKFHIKFDPLFERTSGPFHTPLVALSSKKYFGAFTYLNLLSLYAPPLKSIRKTLKRFSSKADFKYWLFSEIYTGNQVSRETWAQHLGVSRQTLYNWENFLDVDEYFHPVQVVPVQTFRNEEMAKQRATILNASSTSHGYFVSGLTVMQRDADVFKLNFKEFYEKDLAVGWLSSNGLKTHRNNYRKLLRRGEVKSKAPTG